MPRKHQMLRLVKDPLDMLSDKGQKIGVQKAFFQMFKFEGKSYVEFHELTFSFFFKIN